MAEEEATQASTFGDIRFFGILSELAETHSLKSIIYGIHDADDQGFAEDPVASLRFASPDFAVEPWIYALMRANENMRRLQGQIISDSPSNPDLRKSFIDLINHAILSLVFWDEDQEDCLIFEALDGEEEADD